MATKTTAKKTTTVAKKAAVKSRTRAVVAKTAVAKTRGKAAVAKTKATAETTPATLKQVATRSRRKVTSVVHLTRDASLKLIDSQRAIWLAGLGALAKVTTSTGTKGEKAFEALVKAGKKFESQGRGAIDSNADLLKVRISDASNVVDQGIDSVSDAFNARVKKALARVGYPKSSYPEK
ncbi:phasin family protein [Rhodoferax sp.]|uniref:phasin family protein n=1 Tax=Rhodoferax sp. TaxID=50421 RepID=UPI00271EA4A3|nr:phasin family protein [Rhodoferax sp.]MDO9194877.1 phasin family protein [Rhodoferax sp.]